MSRRLAILLITVVTVMTATWPLVTRLDRSIPQGKESSATVPIFNLWTVGWNLDRACHGWRGFWDAPHFTPTPKTLALSEPLVTSQWLVGVAWLPTTVAYNLFLLSALLLNAGITYWALDRRGMCWPVALLASLAMARLPFVHWQLGALQCVLVAGIIGTIHFADDALATGRTKAFWLAAVCFDLTYLTCGYYGFFMVLLMPVWASVLLWQRVRSNTWFTNWRSLSVRVLGTSLILAAIAPVVVSQTRVLSDPNYERPRDRIQDLSARPTDYLETPFPEWMQFVGLSEWHEHGRWKLSPGLLKSLLAILGLVVGLRNRRHRIWTLTWLALAMSAFVGSLGLNWKIAGWSPYATLLDWFPTLARLRTPARMSVIVQIAVVFLAAEALQWGFRRARIVGRTPTCVQPLIGSRIPRFRASLALGLVWMIGLAACWEVVLPRQAFVEVPRVESQNGWIDWLKRHTHKEAIIAHIPFPKGPLPQDYESEVWAMYWGLFHHRRMVNGYSGFFPASYLELKSQMQKFPNEESWAALRSRGVTHCVVRQSFVEEQQLHEHPLATEPWELAFQDSVAGVAIFRLRP